MKHSGEIPFSNLTPISKLKGKETELYITEVKEAVRNFLQKQPYDVKSKVSLFESRYLRRYDTLFFFLTVDEIDLFLKRLRGKIYRFYEKFVVFDGK